MSTTRVASSLAGRSLVLIPRVPSTFVPSLIFPIFSVVAFSGAFSAVANIPGFPVPKVIDWMLPMSIVQGAAFSGMTVGMGIARDLESGFFDRLLLAPVKPLGLIAGARLRGGVPGGLMLLVASLGTALSGAGWSIGLALRAKSMQIAPLMQMGIFLAVFLSTAQVPLNVMTGWLHQVARFNPMTNILALSRQGFIGDVTWAQTWPGLIALAGGIVVLSLFAVRGLRGLVP